MLTLTPKPPSSAPFRPSECGTGGDDSVKLTFFSTCTPSINLPMPSTVRISFPPRGPSGSPTKRIAPAGRGHLLTPSVFRACACGRWPALDLDVVAEKRSMKLYSSLIFSSRFSCSAVSTRSTSWLDSYQNS